MNTHHSKIFVIILIGFCFFVPRFALGQVHQHSHAQMRIPAQESSHSPPVVAPMKTEPSEEQKSVRWSMDFLNQIKEFDQAVSLYQKATASGERRVAIEKMVALAQNTTEAARAYAFALDCKIPCKHDGLRAFDKMAEFATQFSDIELILRVTEHSSLESPMIEPDKRQLEIARRKVIDIADTKEEIKYIFQLMPAGSAEEKLALDKLNKFEKPRESNRH